MKLKAMTSLAFLFVLIIVGCNQGKKANPLEVSSGEGKAKGSLQLRGEPIDLKYAYAIKRLSGFIVLLTDEAIPEASLKSFGQSFDRKLLEGIWGIILHLEDSGKIDLYEMQYGSGFKMGGVEELAVLNCKVENGRIIGEVKYPKAGDQSEKSFAVGFDAPLEN
jgi:hypothetical protein